MEGPLETVLDRGPAHVLGRSGDGLAYAFMARAEGVEAFAHKQLYVLRGLLNVTTHPLDLGTNYIGCAFPDVPYRRLEEGATHEASIVASLGLSLFEMCRPLHERGLFHGAISARRILLSDQGDLMIRDCGVVSATQMNITSHFTLQTSGLERVFGPASTLPPEILRGDALSSHTDVFLIGAVLYELLTARMAFDAGSTLGRYQRISQGNFTRLHKDFGELGRWLHRCLCSTPLDRPTPDESIEVLRAAAASAEYATLFSSDVVLFSETISGPKDADFSEPFLASDVEGARALGLWEAQLIARRARTKNAKPRSRWGSWIAIIFLAIVTWIFIDMGTEEMRSGSYDGRPGPAPQKKLDPKERYESRHKRGHRRRADRGQRLPRRGPSL